MGLISNIWDTLRGNNQQGTPFFSQIYTRVWNFNKHQHERNKWSIISLSIKPFCKYHY